MTFLQYAGLLILASLLTPIVAYVTVKVSVFAYHSGRTRYKRYVRNLKREKSNGNTK